MLFTDTLAKYSTHVLSAGTDKDTDHSYGEMYNDLFGKLVGQVSVLEIGVQHGGFLQAVAEFLPSAQVHGVDISLQRLHGGWDWTNPNIHTYQMNGTLASTAKAVNTQFDLIIDDASHAPDDQVAAVEVFAPYLKPGGTFVVEDIDGAHEAYVREKLEALAPVHGLSLQWLDLRQRKQRWDDIVAILTK